MTLDVAGGVLGVRHHLVGDVLTLALAQQLLQADDGGEDEGDFADQEGLAGDEGDGAQRELPEEGGLERHGGHERAHELAAFLLLPSALLFAFGEGIGDVAKGARCGTHGIHDLTTLQVDFDGVGIQEASDAVVDERLDGVLAGDGPRCSLLRLVAGLDDLDALRKRDGVLVTQHLVHEVEQLVFEAGHGILAQAVAVDGVQQVALGLDRVAAGFVLGGKRVHGYRGAQEQCGESHRHGHCCLFGVRVFVVFDSGCVGIYRAIPSPPAGLVAIWVQGTVMTAAGRNLGPLSQRARLTSFRVPCAICRRRRRPAPGYAAV